MLKLSASQAGWRCLSPVTFGHVAITEREEQELTIANAKSCIFAVGQIMCENVWVFCLAGGSIPPSYCA